MYLIDIVITKPRNITQELWTMKCNTPLKYIIQKYYYVSYILYENYLYWKLIFLETQTPQVWPIKF